MVYQSNSYVFGKNIYSAVIQWRILEMANKLIKNIIQNKNWSLVEKIILEAMAAAEEYAKEHPEMTGEEKLDFALVAIKSGAQAAGITIDEKLLKKIIAYIEKMCTWSKKVN